MPKLIMWLMMLKGRPPGSLLGHDIFRSTKSELGWLALDRM